MDFELSCIGVVGFVVSFFSVQDVTLVILFHLQLFGQKDDSVASKMVENVPRGPFVSGIGMGPTMESRATIICY